MREKETVYTWETKCRKCGKIVEWYFGNDRMSDDCTFTKCVYAKLENSCELGHCEKCKMQTVQDFIGYKIKKAGD